LDHLYCEHDGQQLQMPEPDAPLEEIGPFTIGQYRCFARLGEGGMGVVYKARHQHLDRLSAVKVLLPETAHLPEAVSRFRREAQIASSINHPNSVVIYDYGEVSEQLFYLAMEFIAGKSLAQILKPKREPLPLPLARTLSITRQICDVLDAAHQVGIIHRDLKPHNVMIFDRAGKTDLVKVVDFGLARSVGHRTDSLPGVVVGTPAFMSPEQARGEMHIDARTDIFSLALMVYQMLSGAVPFPTDGLDLWSQVMRRGNLVEPPPPLSLLRPELRIPAEVDAVLALALAPDRNERTPTAALFIEQLEKAARR
jgi:serine/threonine-protein kinase